MIDWHAVGIVAFWLFVAGGFVAGIVEMYSAGRRPRQQPIVMERQEFADTGPVRAIVRHGRRPAPLVRVAPYLDDADRTDVIAMEHTKALEKWDLPVPAATYKSHNGWEPEP